MVPAMSMGIVVLRMVDPISGWVMPTRRVMHSLRDRMWGVNGWAAWPWGVGSVVPLLSGYLIHQFTQRGLHRLLRHDAQTHAEIEPQNRHCPPS
jgi:hypothetical protein